MFKNKLAAVIMAVFTAITFSVAAQTAEAKPVRPAPGQVLVPPQVRETAELQKISKRFDIDASVLQTEFERGWGFKELRHAALLSLASGKNINEILRLKENNSWPRVEYLTGITPNDIKAARDRNDARYFAAALGLKEKDILPYLRQNYSLNDVCCMPHCWHKLLAARQRAFWLLIVRRRMTGVMWLMNWMSVVKS